MKGKYWPDHLARGYIEIGGVRHSLVHLRPFAYVAQIEESSNVVTAVQVSVEFSSHCISKGPRKGQHFDFSQIGHSFLVIDERRIWRKFLTVRHAASTVLPEIIRTLAERPCLFTSQTNFLTRELRELIPGYPAGTQYEVYFNVKRQGNLKVLVFVESAYVRDEDSDNDPYKFKKDDRIKGWRLLLNRGRGRPVRRPPGRGR
ncbi:hypothetical protein J7J08_08465 [Stenotrophomonas sp. ISL-67]|uniref:hypothetical protein n=1 Tax=Stenotrophomonas sp. ISL-67 TaxID=2819171 RepID=UPI001BE622BF|nr:hypothetical protein [Stenotrophomonas sp. ISL-67]MBT2767671.1 hypothetical protein [Stenotrophomonas sp. ISL-67]